MFVELLGAWRTPHQSLWSATGPGELRVVRANDFFPLCAGGGQRVLLKYGWWGYRPSAASAPAAPCGDL